MKFDKGLLEFSGMELLVQRAPVKPEQSTPISNYPTFYFIITVNEGKPPL